MMIDITTLEYLLNSVGYKPTAIIHDGDGSHTVYVPDKRGMTSGTIHKRIKKASDKGKCNLLCTRFGADKRGLYLVIREWSSYNDDN